MTGTKSFNPQPTARKSFNPAANGEKVALFACFGVSIDVFPGFSYSYSALAVLVLVLVLEDTASSTSTISLSTSTIKAKTAQLQKPTARKSLFPTHGVLSIATNRNILDVSSINVKSIPSEKVFCHGCLHSSTSTSAGTSTSASTTKSDALPSSTWSRQTVATPWSTK
jgi:hypothetical protein